MTAAVVQGIITAAAPTLAVCVAWALQHRRLVVIHELVNSRLTVALATIERLEKEIQALVADRSNVP